MPQALSVIWKNIESLDKLSMEKMDEVLGLGLANFTPDKVKIPEKIQILLDQREELRRIKKYAEADRIRSKLVKMGYKVEDK